MVVKVRRKWRDEFRIVGAVVYVAPHSQMRMWRFRPTMSGLTESIRPPPMFLKICLLHFMGRADLYLSASAVKWSLVTNSQEKRRKP